MQQNTSDMEKLCMGYCESTEDGLLAQNPQVFLEQQYWNLNFRDEQKLDKWEEIGKTT